MALKTDCRGQQPKRNWDRFLKRLNSNAWSLENNWQDSAWFYAAISVLYFTLIGIVIVILLLAPKYKSATIVNDAAPSSVTEKFTTPPIQEVPDIADETLDITETKDSIDALPRDPLYYDIDPRSPIFRGQDHTFDNKEDETNRLRINSKFLQD